MLFWLTRANGGSPLSWQHISAVLRGKFGP
jgi:hypothetical protein